jgi:hypothetical protein
MSRNDITGDEIKSKIITETFRENFDRIFKGIVCDKCNQPIIGTHTCKPKAEWNDYQEEK